MQLKGFVMGLKDLISSLFTYKQPEKHSFVLLESNDEESNSNNNQNSKNTASVPETKKIFPALSVNLEYVKTKYNSMIEKLKSLTFLNIFWVV